jgi:predicted HTH domain antitoxin
VSQILLDIPDHSLPALNVPAEAAGGEVRLLAAMKLFELGRLSSGAAAEFAGISRVAFLSKLGEYGIPTFRMSEEELRGDLEHA